MSIVSSRFQIVFQKSFFKNYVILGFHEWRYVGARINSCWAQKSKKVFLFLLYIILLLILEKINILKNHILLHV